MIKAFINDSAENTYIISEKNQAIIVDPGASLNEIAAYLTTNQLTLQYVLLTHGHIDHFIGLNDILAQYDVKVYIHKEERDFLFDANLNLSSLLFNKITVVDKKRVETFLEPHSFHLCDSVIDVTHLPGHTRGGCSYKYKNYVFSGDILFMNGVGRTDLPTGSETALESSINKLLNKYSDNTIIYPGHGQHLTVLTLKNNCPYYHK